jgi:hypothetical protein
MTPRRRSDVEAEMGIKEEGGGKEDEGGGIFRSRAD